MKKYYLITLLQGLVLTVMGQRMGGKIVTGSTQQGLAQVSIHVQPQNKTIFTDKDGKFTLNLPNGSYSLNISHVGFIKKSVQLVVPFKGELVIALEAEVNELQEVVVNTGYQKIAKERATGSFSLVDNGTFNQQIGTDVLSRLEGITPSLSVDRRTGSSGPILMVRGLSTIRGDRSPLIILDDFPYGGDLANINPNDVENITVLKDAAAASIWGAKAGNGVIVITTKKGKFNQKLQLDFNASTSLNSVSTLNEYHNLNSADAVAVEQMLFGKGYYASQENSTARIPLSPAVELMIANRTGKLSAADLALQLEALGKQDIRENYRDAFLRNGINQQYSLGVHGGSNKMNWYLFTGYDQNRSEIGGLFKRLNLRMDNTLQVSQKFDVGLSLYLTGTNDFSGRTKLSSMTTSNGFLPAYTQFADEFGNALPVMKNYRSSYVSALAGGALLDWNYYPLTDGEFMPSSTTKFDLLGNLRLNYQLVKGLKLGINYQYEKQQNDNGTKYGVDSYYVRNLVNQFTQVNGTTLTQPLPYGGIYHDGKEITTVNNVRGQLNYDGRFGDFSINALAGTEFRDAQTATTTVTNYGVDAEILKTTAVDYVNPYKSIINGSNLYIPYRNDYTGTIGRYISAYANAALNYKAKYTLSASARRDASNVFGVATNDLWNPLWSVGGAWLLSEEKMLKTKFLPYARIRMSYGSSGNSDGKRAAVTTVVFNGVSIYTRTPYANFSNYANPDLKWETVNTFNLGGDFRWLNDRLSLAVDYYVKKSSDLIENAPIDYTGGIGFQAYKNTAKISVRGLDLELSSVNTRGQLKWTTSLFANFYKDRTDAYYRNSMAASTAVNGSTIVSGVIGKPVYSIYAYKWAGLNPVNGNPMGYLNGAVSEDYTTMLGANATIDDLAYIGRTFPTLTGAVGNNFKWKGINLDFRVAYKMGYYFRRSGLSYSDLYSLRLGHREYSERWQQTGDELLTSVPSAIYPAVTVRDNFYNLSEATIVKGDHVRLQYVGLGYVFSKANFASLPFQNMTVRFVANNLGLLWRANKHHIDPDYPGALPNKTYSFNLQFNL